MKIFLLIPLVASFVVQAQVQRYHPERTRQVLKDLTNRPVPQLEIVGEPGSPQAKEFLNFFATEIFPAQVKMHELLLRYYSNHLRKDSGSYSTDQERDELDAAQLAAINEYSKQLTDPVVAERVAKYAKLAEGLSGPMADSARRALRMHELSSFSEEMAPVVEEMNNLYQKFNIAVDQTAAKAEVPRFAKNLTTVRRLYKDRKITLAQAKRRLANLFRENAYLNVGHQATLATGQTLNQLAVVRTRLAKSKGYATWAAYQLEVDGQGYEPAYRGPAKQREFLEQYLAALKPLYENFIAERKKALGIDGELMTEDVALLKLQDTGMLQKYFPNAKITDIWERAIIDSGFDPEVLTQIVVDDEAREKKFLTGAYMAPVLAPEPVVTKVDAAKLDYIHAPKGLAGREPGFVYILQNYQGAGVRDLEVAFHEGGHALDQVLAYQVNPEPDAYGYVEVPSMSMERFLADPEFLRANATPVDGQLPTPERFAELTANSQKNSIVTLVMMAKGALFDTKLWDYDYDAPGAQTFLERVEALDRELEIYEAGLKSYPTNGPSYFYWLGFPHYVSGNVRDIGYTFAEIGSRMMASFVSDEIERTSGRRSWNQQPGLATIFADQFYNQGWKYLFPTNIEKITGRKFDPAGVVADLAKILKCEELL